jgi:hypothetical protein
VQPSLAACKGQAWIAQVGCGGCVPLPAGLEKTAAYIAAPFSVCIQIKTSVCCIQIKKRR